MPRRSARHAITASECRPVERGARWVRLSDADALIPAGGALAEDVDGVGLDIDHSTEPGDQLVHVVGIQPQQEDRLLDPVSESLQNGRDSRTNVIDTDVVGNHVCQRHERPVHGSPFTIVRLSLCA